MPFRPRVQTSSSGPVYCCASTFRLSNVAHTPVIERNSVRMSFPIVYGSLSPLRFLLLGAHPSPKRGSTVISYFPSLLERVCWSRGQFRVPVLSFSVATTNRGGKHD